MRKQFAVNLLFLFMANLVVKPFWIFGIDRVVQNQVGAAVYGTYFAVFNYSFLLAIILDFGINNFNNRAVSRNPARAGEYVWNLLSVKFCLSILYFIFTIFSAISAGYNGLQTDMLWFLALNQILLSVILFLRSNVAALQLFKTDSLLSVLDRLLTIIFCLLLLYAPALKSSFNILWFIYAQSLALFITCIVAAAVIMRHTILKFHFWKFRFTKLVLLKSTPFALLALLMGIYYRIDGVMIERMRGATEAGIYAASFRLLDALSMFGYLFATLLLPMFARMIRNKKEVNHLTQFSAELMGVMSVIAGVSCFFFRTEIMHMLYHDSTSYWANIFGLLMLTFIPMSSVYVFGTLLTANGSMKVLNKIAACGVVINVGFNFVLIPKHGALGASVATLVTQMFAALVHIIAANGIFKFNHKASVGFKFILFGTSCAFVSWSIQFSGFSWMINFFLAIALCLLLASGLKLVPLREVVALVKTKAAS